MELETTVKVENIDPDEIIWENKRESESEWDEDTNTEFNEWNIKKELEHCDEITIEDEGVWNVHLGESGENKDAPKTSKQPKKSTKHLKYYQCDICGHTYLKKENLKIHIFKKHIDIFTHVYKCKECNFSAKFKEHVLDHAKLHSSNKNFLCSFCNYPSNSTEAFSKHMYTHAIEKPHKCTHCSYSCAQKKNLTSHLKLHTGEKPFKCTECNYSSIRKQDLKSHMRKHSDSKPHKCPYCSYKTAHKYDKNAHIVRIHSGEKPFKCQFCSFSTAHRSSLAQHLLRHTGKPFECNKCSKTFTRRYILDKHLGSCGTLKTGKKKPL